MIAWNATSPMPAWMHGAGPESDVVVSTRVRLARNLANHQFPRSASLLERNSVFEEVAAAVRGSECCAGFEIINFCRLPRIEQQFLVEERLASPDLLKAEGDRGVACDASRRLSFMVNEEDHVRMQCLEAGYQPREVFGAVDALDDGLGKALGFAFDRRRGFLTSCPTNSGTGLRVSFLMHLPALVLTKEIDQALRGASQMGIATRGFFGEHSEAVGALFQLSNQATLGAQELEFLSATETIVSRIMNLERDARTRILKDARAEVEDRIHRAYGILMHARLLEVGECINLTSALRLGIEIGVWNAVTRDILSRLTLSILPAHMHVAAGRELDSREMCAVRADMVRAALQGTEN